MHVKATGQSWVSSSRICSHHLRQDLLLAWSSPIKLTTKLLGSFYCHFWALELTNTHHHTWHFYMGPGDQIHASSDWLSLPPPPHRHFFMSKYNSRYKNIFGKLYQLYYTFYVFIYTYIHTKHKENHTCLFHLRCWTGRVYAQLFLLLFIDRGSLNTPGWSWIYRIPLPHPP